MTQYITENEDDDEEEVEQGVEEQQGIGGDETQNGGGALVGGGRGIATTACTKTQSLFSPQPTLEELFTSPPLLSQVSDLFVALLFFQNKGDFSWSHLIFSPVHM